MAYLISGFCWTPKGFSWHIKERRARAWASKGENPSRERVYNPNDSHSQIAPIWYHFDLVWVESSSLDWFDNLVSSLDSGLPNDAYIPMSSVLYRTRTKSRHCMGTMECTLNMPDQPSHIGRIPTLYKHGIGTRSGKMTNLGLDYFWRLYIRSFFYCITIK